MEPRSAVCFSQSEQTVVLLCYLNIIISNASYLISAIILHGSDMKLGLYFIARLYILLNEVLHVYNKHNPKRAINYAQ